MPFSLDICCSGDAFGRCVCLMCYDCYQQWRFDTGIGQPLVCPCCRQPVHSDHRHASETPLVNKQSMSLCDWQSTTGCSSGHGAVSRCAIQKHFVYAHLLSWRKNQWRAFTANNHPYQWEPSLSIDHPVVPIYCLGCVPGIAPACRCGSVNRKPMVPFFWKFPCLP